MNKFLMGTSALVAASAFAAPTFAAERLQLQIRGYNTSGISYTDADYEEGYTFFDEDGSVYDSDSYSPSQDTNEVNFGSSSEIHFIGSTTLDNGLEVTFHAELELEQDSAAAQNYWYEEADTIDEVYIQFDGGFGRVQFGQQDGVMDQMAVTAPSTFMGHSHNDLEDRSMDPFAPLIGGGNSINTVGDLSGDSTKIIYFTPSMNGLQLGFSYTPNPCKNTAGYAGCVWDEYGRNFWEVSGSWQGTYNNVSFEFSGGYGQGEGYYFYDDPSEWTLGANIGFGGFTIGGSYKDTNARRYHDWGLDPAPIGAHNSGYNYEETDWDVGITYESGPWGFNLAYGRRDSDNVFACDFSCGYFDAADSNFDSIYYYEVEAESWIGGVTYKYGPGMQIGAGVTTYNWDNSERGVAYDSLPGGNPNGYVDHRWESFDGWSFFIENTITF